jgi:sodium transport system permease protein
MNAFFVGLILGYIAVQSGSIFPGMVFHFTHNSLAILYARITPDLCERWPVLQSLMTPAKDGGGEYHWPFIVFSGLVAALILLWFGQLPYFKTAEERLQEAIVRGKEESPEDEDISIRLASMIK